MNTSHILGRKFLEERTYAQTRKPTEQASTINPEVYYDEHYYALEKEQVFRRNWVTAGLAQDIKNPGDIMLAKVADQSILITRSSDGELHAFYNVCRHRGTALCDKASTNNKNIVCPYHGWAYSLEGECLGTPLFDKGVNRKVVEMHDMSHLEAFDKKDFGLLKVRVAQWGFMIFVCLDDEAPSLEEMLGDLPECLANFKLDEWVSTADKQYDIACNWKLLVENAIEYYHLPWVHPTLAETSKVSDHHRWQGKGMYCGICTSPITTTDDADWLNMKNMSGLSELQNNSGYFFGLFPNLIVFILPNHAFVILSEPVSPTRTIETAWLLSHPDSIEHSTEKDIASVMNFWDMVNIEDVGICERVQLGLMNKAYPGGRMCYHFEDTVHRFQNMIIDQMLGIRNIPEGDAKEQRLRYG